LLFLVFSTGWVPLALASRLEEKYPSFKPASLQGHKGKLYIHILGSGYNVFDNAPATSELCIVAKGRLMEAMRLYRAIDSSILVCSAGGLYGIATQAEVTRQAAILLGADSSRIIKLDTPNSTMEEAVALAGTIEKKSTLIVVTDGIHMPRAIKFFTAQGFSPLAAPTNFRALKGKYDITFKWFPQLEYLELTDRVLHEYFGNLKASL
jgi:uncharacterized SAM-binding protein YcdF (DUF218 family)